MFRLLSVVAICLALPVFADDASEPISGGLTYEDVATARQRLLDLARPTEVLLDAACCKVCSKGKACGNSCISRDKRCHKGVGCACDG